MIKKISLILIIICFIFVLSACTDDGDRRFDEYDYSLDDNSFYGYECTQDCSGHQAGYDWAEKKGIASTDDCSGKSQSFIEGCWAYVEQNY